MMERLLGNRKYSVLIKIIMGCGVVLLLIVLSLPVLIAYSIQYEQDRAASTIKGQFPVTVDPRNKLIVESAKVNDLLEGEHSPLQATTNDDGNVVTRGLAWLARGIAQMPWYQSLASVNGRVVVVTSGMRKEQVAQTFGTTLGWTAAQKKQFLTTSTNAQLPLSEGSYLEGIYFVDKGMTPSMAQVLVNENFTKEILAHYGTTTASLVPLSQALTVASLIEREAGGPDDMRIISGIIWNRLFLGMNLQIDATLQYAKASTPATNSWWPRVIPADRFIKSVFNTYKHAGLPPAPIASPSVAAVIAALNPKSTSCIYYFHDDDGVFHCSATYEEHVTELKKIYGRGK